MIENISHITFIVRGIEKSCQFFKYIFDAKEVYDSKAKINKNSLPHIRASCCKLPLFF